LTTRRELLQLAALAAPLLFTRCAESAEPKPMPGVQPLGIDKGRDGYVYVPGSAPAAGAPLVVYLHGAGGSGGRAVQYVIADADRTGSIVIAPDSRKMTWGFSGEDSIADLVFLDEALDKIMTAHKVDERRVGISGFSDGASMALSWGLVNGKLFSAIAAFSPGFVHLSKPPLGKPRVFISHGTRDRVLPVDRCGRRIARELRAAGYEVDYREFDGDHTVPAELGKAGWDSMVSSRA
jgi:phospholipase/carboxylesterase